MINKIKILYIGNDNSKKSSYVNTMFTLSRLLEKEGYSLICSSNQDNKFFRLLDMCFSVIKQRNKTDYILIDTFSTLNFYYAFFVSQLARIFKIKYIPILHGGNLPMRLDKSSYLSKLIFNHSYKNIAPSNYLKHAFKNKGFNAEYIPNILEIEHYKFKDRPVLQPKLFWVRAFKYLYNPMLAIDVVIKLKSKYPSIKLSMIGPHMDSSYDEVFKKIVKEKLENNIEITGVLPKKQWHQKSEEYDFMINTTNFDNTPVSIMEGMALGLQIISTNVGGMPYLIDNGIDGVLVDKENPNLMSKAIDDLIINSSNKMILNARKKAEGFGWEVVKNKWLEILI
tara:strand:+ start:32989 stop:34005 length:1017 start_codon:yes stop_codon:yes gene_type:complete